MDRWRAAARGALGEEESRGRVYSRCEATEPGNWVMTACQCSRIL
jgi:hypothetical protein